MHNTLHQFNNPLNLNTYRSYYSHLQLTAIICQQEGSALLKTWIILQPSSKVFFINISVHAEWSLMGKENKRICQISGHGFLKYLRSGRLVTRELLKQYLTENKLVIYRVVAYGRWLCLRSVVTMRELTVMGYCIIFMSVPALPPWLRTYKMTFSSYPWRLAKIASTPEDFHKIWVYPWRIGSYPWRIQVYPRRISWKLRLHPQRIPHFLTLPLKKSSIFITYPGEFHGSSTGACGY